MRTGTGLRYAPMFSTHGSSSGRWAGHGRLLAFGENERAMFAADEALASGRRGRPLLDSIDWEPARIEVERLEELRHEAEEIRLDAALRAGLHSEVLATASGRACGGHAHP